MPRKYILYCAYLGEMRAPKDITFGRICMLTYAIAYVLLNNPAQSPVVQNKFCHELAVKSILDMVTPR
jgi:hypothetical protein